MIEFILLALLLFICFTFQINTMSFILLNCVGFIIYLCFRDQTELDPY